MDEYVMNMIDFVNKPAVIDTFVDILLCLVPIWVAVMIGLVIGWSWRPRWTGLICLGLRSKLRFAWTAPPGFGARRLWLAFTALSAFSVCRKLWFDFRGRKRKDSVVGGRGLGRDAANDVPAASGSDSVLVRGSDSAGEGISDEINCSCVTSGEGLGVVTENDLDHLLHLLDQKDGDAGWLSMMERSTSNLACQAWRYEPETGPTMYRTRTVFEDATPDLVRDFFWDDEFRPKWDPMLTHIKILEECPETGAMIIHWIKKFPFFCSDREYIIGRRIWEAGKTYYCVTKGVPYPALQRRDKPRRVDDYFSSWVIRPVLSRKGDGQLSACEVILIHYEDMGIPKDVAKVGVRHGMWGTLKKMNAGLRAYQNASKLEASSLSRCAQMARITTKMSLDGTDNSSEPASREEETVADVDVQRGRGSNEGIDWKWIVLGGTVAMAFGLHTGVVGKAVLFGAGQRLARRR